MSGDMTRELVRMMDKRATGQGATVGTSAGSIPPHSHTQTRGISFYLDGDLVVETNAMSFVVPVGLNVVEVKLAVDTAPTGADLIIDINKNGVTLFTTQANRPKILAGASSGTSVAPNVSALTVGDKVTLEIDQIGSTVAGGNLAVMVICTS